MLLFSDARGAYKRTYTKRFEKFDQKVYEFLKQSLSATEQIKAHDVGVSDGRTSVDFYNKVHDLFPNIHFTVSDYNPTIKILEKWRLKVVLAESNKMLEITYPPFVFNTMKRDSYPLNHIIRKIIEWLYVTPLVKSFQQGRNQAKQVFLLAPSAINLQKKTMNILI